MSWKAYYYKIFGKENYGSRWIISSNNILEIGRNCKFAVSYFTSTCLDLLKFKIPTIELLNLKNIPEEDNENSLKDENGYPILQYRNLALCLTANNYDELEKVVIEIFKNRNNLTNNLIENYKKYIKESNDYSKKISELIINE